MSEELSIDKILAGDTLSLETARQVIVSQQEQVVSQQEQIAELRSIIEKFQEKNPTP